MKKLIRWFTALSFTLSVIPQSFARTPDHKIFHQFVVNKVIENSLGELKNVKSGTDAAKVLTPFLRADDQKFFNSNLKGMGHFPTFKQLNRGFSYTLDGQTFVFEVVDIFQNKYLINGKVPWQYTPNNSLQVQMDTVAKKLGTQKTSAFQFLVPEAHADFTMFLLGLLAGAVILPLIDWVRNEYLRPNWDAYYCEGKDQNDYRYSKMCGEYFKFMAAQRISIPDAKPVPKGQEKLPFSPIPPKCYSEASPTFEQDFESPDQKVIIRRTIKYDENRKAKEMVEEQVKPPAPNKKLIYRLNDKAQLFEVLENDKILLTRDPTKKELMNDKSFEKMKTFDTVIDNILGSIKLCDEAAQAQLKKEAEEPGSLVAKHILTSDEGQVPAKESGGAKSTK